MLVKAVNIVVFLYLAAGVSFGLYIEHSERRRLAFIQFLSVAICWLPVIVFYGARDEGDDDDVR